MCGCAFPVYRQGTGHRIRYRYGYRYRLGIGTGIDKAEQPGSLFSFSPKGAPGGGKIGLSSRAEGRWREDEGREEKRREEKRREEKREKRRETRQDERRKEVYGVL